MRIDFQKETSGTDIYGNLSRGPIYMPGGGEGKMSELAVAKLENQLNQNIADALESKGYVVMRDGATFYIPNRLGGQVRIHQNGNVTARGSISFDNCGGEKEIPDARIDFNEALKVLVRQGYSCRLVKTSEERQMAAKSIEMVIRSAKRTF